MARSALKKEAEGVWERIGRFHRSEGGMEAIQAVMILGFSAVVVLAIWNVWTTLPVTVNGKQVLGIRGWFQEVVSSLLTLDAG
ncbi:MAG: hypothetical protein LW700_15145 [Gemmataceae bacterium]|nr:hypothetical protein [Gemmataceae bacterium]